MARKQLTTPAKPLERDVRVSIRSLDGDILSQHEPDRLLDLPKDLDRIETAPPQSTAVGARAGRPTVETQRAMWHEFGAPMEADSQISGEAETNAGSDAPDVALESIERASMDLESATVERAKTVALLSAGRVRIDRIQSETRRLLDQLLEER